VDEDTVYLIGDYVVDSAAKRVMAVLSTENLLLNGYRQKQTGQGMVLVSTPLIGTRPVGFSFCL